MPASPVPEDAPSRDFTVSTLVVWRNCLLLHRHKKLGRYLPCGGHIEANELPDEAAYRETLEESGVPIVLVGERVLELEQPQQLVRPRGVQLETIYPGHQHIDLIYLARPVPEYDGFLLESDPSLGWFDADALLDLGLDAEMQQWAALALLELADNATDN